MGAESLAAALEREHHEIDEGIEAFTAEPATGSRDPKPLVRAIQALRRHIYLEEEFLFPPLREAGLMAPVFVMLREHGQMWESLDSLERDLEADPNAASILLVCHQLTVQLQHHNMKEERILYTQADQVLTAPASEHLKEFLASGELPEGWVCIKAR